MPLDAFLQFKGQGPAGQPIEGETKDKQMLGEGKYSSPPPFDLQDWRFGVSQEVNVGSAAGGIGAGKVTFEQFAVTKQIDKSSPKFFETCCSGGHYDECRLLIRKAGASKELAGGIYLEFGFKLVFVANIAWSGDDSPAPKEEITFDYGAIEVVYKPQQTTGEITGDKHAAWSRVLNNNDFKVVPGG